jgi:hypothetical protein
VGRPDELVDLPIRLFFFLFPQRLTVAWICFLNAASDGETRHNAAHDED